MKLTRTLNCAFASALALFLTVSMLTACGGGDPNEKETKALIKNNMEILGYDAPSATVRAFFEALAVGKIQVAESMVEADNLPIAKRYISDVIGKTEEVWISPYSYIWSGGNMAAVDYHRMWRENVLLIKTGDAWKLRFQDTNSQYATKFPEEIDKKNDEIFGEEKYTFKMK